MKYFLTVIYLQHSFTSFVFFKIKKYFNVQHFKHESFFVTINKYLKENISDFFRVWAKVNWRKHQEHVLLCFVLSLIFRFFFSIMKIRKHWHFCRYVYVWWLVLIYFFGQVLWDLIRTDEWDLYQINYT